MVGIEGIPISIVTAFNKFNNLHLRVLFHLRTILLVIVMLIGKSLYKNVYNLILLSNHGNSVETVRIYDIQLRLYLIFALYFSIL